MKRAFSITKRLTILSTFVSCLILSLATGYLYFDLKNGIEKKDVKLLMEEVGELRSLLQESPHDWQGMKEDLRMEESASSRLTKYYKRILDDNRKTLLSSTGMEQILPVDVFPAPHGIVDYSASWEKWHSKDNKVFLLVSVWSDPSQMRQKRYILQSAVDITRDEYLLSAYRFKIVFVLFVGLIVSCLVNMWVAKSGIRPLDKMARKARSITVNHLHERISLDGWPKELETLAASFDEMLTRLEESFTRLSRFSVDVAHELRTPINNLMGEAQVALSKTRNPDEYKEVLGSALEEYSRLTRMIDNLLFLARSENNEIRIEPVSINVREEIEKVIEFYDAIAKEGEIAVSCKGEGVLRADLILFRRVINNLLSNAIQYSKKGGAVTVSINESSKEKLDILIKDTGIGIDAESLPNVFKRFFRTSAAKIQNPQGMGVGLYMVKSIMNLHNGTVAIQSLPDEGTTVTISFPRQISQITKM